MIADSIDGMGNCDKKRGVTSEEVDYEEDANQTIEEMRRRIKENMRRKMERSKEGGVWLKRATMVPKSPDVSLGCWYRG